MVPMGSRKLNGWEFTCDNPACGKVEAIYKVRNIFADTAWLQGEVDQDEGKTVEFTACEPECLQGAITAVLEIRTKRSKADISEVGGY